jgi:hypothetical protein
MPVHIGTEMNKKGLPFADDLNGADLKPYKKVFVEGAKVVVGHTLLGRFAGFNYLGDESESEFKNLKMKNEFFASVGALPAITKNISEKLKNAGKRKAFGLISDSAKKGKWII